MTENFVTIFNRDFLPQGLNLYDSLKKNSKDFFLWVLCVDKETEVILKKLNKTNLKIISVNDYENDVLSNIKQNRTISEYCWTLTPLAPKIVFKKSVNLQRVTYVDADMFFFNSSDIVFKEFEDSKKSIMITEHDFDQDHYHKEKKSGKYIVQFLIFNKDNSENVINWWEKKCIESCSAEKTSSSLIGDQGYLNDWHIRFNNQVHVLKNNNAFRSTWSAKKLEKDKLIAWHFHGLRVINNKMILMHTEKVLSEKIINEIYIPYLQNLKKNLDELNIKINQLKSSKNIIMKILSNINFFLIEKKIIKNKRYFIF